MVNAEKVNGLLDHLREYTTALHALAATDREAFLKDRDKKGAAKYYLQVAIESCIDIANHIISSEQLRAPKNYADTFVVLNERGIFPDDFTQTLKKMARMRNRLVHLYWEVDDQEIYKIITTNLGDFDIFTQHILDYLKTLPPPPEESTP